MIEVKIHGLAVNPLTREMIVWLRSLQDNIVIPITIEGTGAASIYMEQAVKSEHYEEAERICKEIPSIRREQQNSG